MCRSTNLFSKRLVVQRLPPPNYTDGMHRLSVKGRKSKLHKCCYLMLPADVHVWGDPVLIHHQRWWPDQESSHQQTLAPVHVGVNGLGFPNYCTWRHSHTKESFWRIKLELSWRFLLSEGNAQVEDWLRVRDFWAPAVWIECWWKLDEWKIII